MSEDAVRLATELQHPFTLALALFFASTVYQALRETQNAARRAAEAIALSRDHGFLLAEAWAMAISGWAAVADGDARMGAALIRQGIDAAIGSGSGAFVPHHLGLLAEAQLLGGELDEGIVSVDEALARARRTGERFYEAELLRLKALLLAGAATNKMALEPENLFRESLTIARQQKAQLFVLRTSLSFARMRLQRSEKREAIELLKSALIESHGQAGLVDLDEARALLAECGHHDRPEIRRR